MRQFQIALILCTLGSLAATAAAQSTSSGIDPEALIERILATERQQAELLHDVTYDAEYIEHEDKGSEGLSEKVRIVKTVYVKYAGDSSLFAEKYLEFYEEGALQSDEKLRKEARERTETRIKRKAHDVSYPMVRPFHPESRELYDITYRGVAEHRIEDRVCHQFRVDARKPADSLINGDYYFEAETFNLVQVEFSPSKLVKKLMFKLNQLNMTVIFAPTSEGYWLPRQFDVRGKGKAALFIGVEFAGTEYYRNPVVNGGLDDSIFEVTYE